MIDLVWCDKTCKPVPFGIVNDEIIPCCVILGMNFFLANSLIVDFHRQVVVSEHNGKYIVVLMNNKLKEETYCQT